MKKYAKNQVKNMLPRSSRKTSVPKISFGTCFLDSPLVRLAPDSYRDDKPTLNLLKKFVLEKMVLSQNNGVNISDNFCIFVYMNRTKYIYLVVIALSSSLLLSSCFLFRSKNKCDTCPSFSHKKKKH